MSGADYDETSAIATQPRPLYRDRVFLGVVAAELLIAVLLAVVVLVVYLVSYTTTGCMFSSCTPIELPLVQTTTSFNYTISKGEWQYFKVHVPRGSGKQMMTLSSTVVLASEGDHGWPAANAICTAVSNSKKPHSCSSTVASATAHYDHSDTFIVGVSTTDAADSADHPLDYTLQLGLSWYYNSLDFGPLFNLIGILALVGFYVSCLVIGTFIVVAHRRSLNSGSTEVEYGMQPIQIDTANYKRV